MVTRVLAMLEGFTAKMSWDSTARRVHSAGEIVALSSHQPMLGDPTPTAVRLIALLPRRAASVNRRSNPADMPSPAHSQSLPKALWIAAYIALLLLNLWLFK